MSIRFAAFAKTDGRNITAISITAGPPPVLFRGGASWLLPETFINVAGRHSFLIYIVHQPVILGVLYVLGLMK